MPSEFDRLIESSEKKSLAQTSWNVLKQASYSSIDFFRIALITQTLTGRWLWQFYVELDRYDAAPNDSVKQTWMGWPIIAAAFTTAAVTKGVNYYYRKQSDAASEHGFDSLDDAFGDSATNAYHHGKSYKGAQDYAYAVFTSSIVYFLLDAVSSTGKLGSINVWWFVGITALVPVVSIGSARTATPDTSDQLIVKPNQLNGVRAYPNADKTEKLLNAITGAVYGANIFILFWNVNREIHGKTVPTEMWQLVVSSLYVVANAAVGYKLTDHPKAFHAVVASSKFMRDASFAYAALSGLAFHILNRLTLEDREAVEMGLTFPFIALSIGIGVFSALTSLFRYDDNHQSYVDNKEMILNLPGKIKDGASSLASSISSCFGSMFSYCCAYCADEEDTTEEHQLLAQYKELDWSEQSPEQVDPDSSWRMSSCFGSMFSYLRSCVSSDSSSSNDDNLFNV